MEENQKASTVGGESAGYLFEFKEEGVYLTVYPNFDGGILFELSDMRQILKEYGVVDYDIELLARVVRTADGIPCRLADHFDAPVGNPGENDNAVTEAVQPVEYKEAAFHIEVSKDGMTATVKLDREPNTVAPSFESIKKALEDKRVVYGIDEKNIESALKNNLSEFVAAKGLPPVQGVDAKIEKKFNLNEKGKPTKDKYDKADYKNMNLFILVKKGDVLAERIPHTLGEMGKTVYGVDVKPKPGKPKPVPAGKNTNIVDENIIVAAIDGQVVEANNKITVDPQFSVRGDVGVGTGNIDFVGAVEIGGNVQPGFSVKATGDIIINGMVNGGTVDGFNVSIKGGVNGMSRGKVLAQENVTATFAENATIEAGNAIIISDVALHSDLRAGRLVAVEGKRGLVTGGYLAAGEEIRAKTIGNHLFVATRLVVGVNPMLQRKYQQTCKDYAEKKKKLSQLTKALNTLGKIDISKLPPARAAQISQMTRSQFPLAGQIERDEKLIKEMEDQIAEMREGRVKVDEKIYPGTKVIINSVMKNILSEEQHCTLSVEEDEVKSGPY
ncbi:MAG: DUF342 domain-containing protein [Schwartzia sp.]|nr:DUF342 domain-containing protein [Schwartzia sp. (in: firmicutes)]